MGNKAIDYLKDFFFNQPFPLQRLAILRIFYSFVSILWITNEVDVQFYSDFALYLYKGIIPLVFGECTFLVLKAITIFWGLLLLVGIFTPVTGVLFIICFISLHYYISHFNTGLSTYNHHLIFMGLMVTLGQNFKYYSIDSTRRDILIRSSSISYASFVLAFCQIYIGMLYFQSGLAKLIHSGIQWYLNGGTIFIFTVLTGTENGKWLTQFPIIFKIFGLLTLMAEFGIIILILAKKQKIGAYIAFLFHFSVWAVMNISFWFLWFLYPAIFLYDKDNYWGRRLDYLFYIVLSIILFSMLILLNRIF